MFLKYSVSVSRAPPQNIIFLVVAVKEHWFRFFEQYFPALL
ncbi:hypothetical Protein YC6258_04790 [Gynuella sunshinyii YC6258]|uniref:Uncharacterized protein n=1 Tax=Gynuella sunshinyii YC6258 TaxID=1445510 RepID=A0A0C5VQH1_9GAMM|nr:hypothetical Protein YC6258_04790 [Gynuella sunshinyii YC6258]